MYPYYYISFSLLLFLLSFSPAQSNENNRRTIYDHKIDNPCTPVAQQTQFDPFTYITGMSEEYFRHKLEQNRVLDGVPYPTLHNRRTKTHFYGGTLLIRSIARFRKRFYRYAPEKPSTFHVVEACETHPDSWFAPFVDLSVLQADPKNRKALFQLETHFNALSATGNPLAVESYRSDHFTHNDAALIGTMPALIGRLFFVRHKKDTRVFWGQQTEQINFLQAFDGVHLPFLALEQGTLVSLNNGTEFNTFSEEQQRTAIDAIQLAMQRNTQVTASNIQKSANGTYTADMTVSTFQPKQLITQLLAGTIDLTDKNQDEYEGLARLVLQAAYEGTVYASMRPMHKKVFLQLIGIDRNNKLTWVVDALVRAVRTIKKYGDLTITLVISDSTKYTVNEWHDAEQTLMHLVQDTGGTWTRYSTQGSYLRSFVS